MVKIMSNEQSNFKRDILDAVTGESIEAVKIHCQRYDDYYYGTGEEVKIDPALLNKVLTWEQAAPIFDYSYNTGFGSMDCHDITVWTESRVFYIYEYDGSTSICNVERNPKS